MIDSNDPGTYDIIDLVRNMEGLPGGTTISADIDHVISPVVRAAGHRKNYSN